MKRWPVFIPWFQHGDGGRHFRVGDVVALPVAFDDSPDWPDEMTTTGLLQLEVDAADGACVRCGQVRASYRGRASAPAILASRWRRWEVRDTDASTVRFSVRPSGADAVADTGLLVQLAVPV